MTSTITTSTPGRQAAVPRHQRLLEHDVAVRAVAPHRLRLVADRQGLPFVGRAGQLLNDMIQKGMGLRREDVYILNVLKCRPPNNRTPNSDEVANCRNYFERQLEILQPEFICCLGLVATQALLHTTSPFKAIHVGGPRELKEFNYVTTEAEFSVTTQYRGNVEELTGVDAVIDFAETFFGGGTDFVTPLSCALDQLREEHRKFGVKGDIVFVTDGMCGVSEDWLKEFKEEQERLAFRVWGVVIGGNRLSEPLNTICDGRVATVNTLLEGGEIAHFFNNV